MKSAVLASLLLAGCSGAGAQAAVTAEKVAPPVQVAAATVETVVAPVAAAKPEKPAAASFEGSTWAGFGVARCSYLAPASAFIAEDGAVDVVWHFHAGQMATADMKASGLRAVFVSCGFGSGFGTGAYSSAFDDPARFTGMMKALTRTIGFKAKRDVHVGHLALASWSAGFAAVNRILGSEDWYEKTDAVLLFDSLHAQYIDLPADAKLKVKPVAARGADHVDTKMLRRFIRFATDAAAGKKRMVITHSSIVPPDYASTAEATAALLGEVDAAVAAGPTGGTDASPFGLPSMIPSVVADTGNLHVRGFRGIGPHDHFDHLHLIGEALRSWIVPGWYSPVSERH